MTKQFQDIFSYRGKNVQVIAISHRFPFSPNRNFGIDAALYCTANYRGFLCEYVIDDLFVLKNLIVFSKSHTYPVIYGKKAEKIPFYIALLEEINRNTKAEKQYIDMFPMQYSGIDEILEYSGRIVLDTEPQQNRYEQYKNRAVYELVFESGILKDTKDITSLWKSVCKRPNGKPIEYWWEEEENKYCNLINHYTSGYS